jgi:hypothetical protein
MMVKKHTSCMEREKRDTSMLQMGNSKQIASQRTIFVSEKVKDTLGSICYLFRRLIASRAPRTPTTPSYFPENGMAST